jgi:hypothetical protein
MKILEKYSITPKHLINSVDDLPTIPVNKFSIELAIELQFCEKTSTRNWKLLIQVGY